MTKPSRVAFITGAARRIGRAIAEDLAGHGWAIAIHYNRSRNDAERLAAEIESNGGRATVVQADLGDPKALPAAISLATDVLGIPSLLVNNASMFEDDRGGIRWHFIC